MSLIFHLQYDCYMYIINTLAPVFLIIILGAALQKTGFINPQLARHNNRLVYWIALPCLLFSKTANAEIAGDAAMRVFGVLVIGCFGCIILAYVISRTLRLSGQVEGAFVQAAFRGNLAYIGLPVVSYALAQLPNSSEFAALNTAQLQSLAVLSFAPLVPIYNVMAVLVLILGNRRSQSNPGSALVRSIVTNPLLLACLVGLSWSITRLPLPLWLNNVCQGIGQMALPLALIGIGVSLTTSTVVSQSGLGNLWVKPRQLTLPLLAAAIKVIAAPILGVLVIHWLGLSPPESTIALLYLACPTAVVSYIMAEQLGGDETLTSQAIVWSTFISAGVLALVLFMFPG